MLKSSRLLALLFAGLASSIIFAQEERVDIFANPQNLRVLPADISSGELSNTMKGFAMGLGLRCENCHVGESNTPLTTFNFASDEKPMKLKARVMLGMVRDINNSYVPKLNEIEAASRTEVKCVTCHRGQKQPKLIEDVMDDQLAANGLEAAVTRYGELREEFYGSHSYDFSEYTLPMYAQTLAVRKKIEEATAFAKINAQNFPESYYSFFALGEFQAAGGQSDEAIASFKRAIELNPGAKAFLESKIGALMDESD